MCNKIECLRAYKLVCLLNLCQTDPKKLLGKKLFDAKAHDKEFELN